MSESAKSSLLGDAFIEAIKLAVREELAVALPHSVNELLTPDELAEKLRLPISWVYEQSRQGNIPTHRLGKYIRFDLGEVLRSQKKTV